MSHIPKITSEYSPTFKRIHVAGIFGGIIPGGLEAIIHSEERRVDEVLQTQPLSLNRMFIKRTAEVELIIDPLQMRSIHKWLEAKIKEYETMFGRIPSPEELESRSKRTPEDT